MTPEQRAARLYHHMYETNEGIAEQSERIVALEELVREMWQVIVHASDGVPYDKERELIDRTRELGVIE